MKNVIKKVVVVGLFSVICILSLMLSFNINTYADDSGDPDEIESIVRDYPEDRYLIDKNKIDIVYNIKLLESKKFTIDVPCNSYAYIYLHHNENEDVDINMYIYDSSKKLVDTIKCNRYKSEYVEKYLSKGKYSIVVKNEGYDSIYDGDDTSTLNDYFAFYFDVSFTPFGCSNINLVKSLRFTKSKYTCSIDKRINVYDNTIVTPSYYWFGKDISFSSSDKNVVKVGGSSLIGYNLGKCTITAKAGNITKKCTVVVDNGYADVLKGKYANPFKYISGYKNGKYKISDEKIVSMDNKCRVKGLKTGKATITATINKQKYTCTVYVNDVSKLKSKTKAKLKDSLIRPSSLEINKDFIAGNMYYIDYSAMNKLGGYDRKRFTGYFQKGKLKTIG